MSDLKQFQFTEATEEEDETYAKAEFLEVISLLIFSGPAQGEGLCTGEGGAGVSQKKRESPDFRSPRLVSLYNVHRQIDAFNLFIVFSGSC